MLKKYRLVDDYLKPYARIKFLYHNNATKQVEESIDE